MSDERQFWCGGCWTRLDRVPTRCPGCGVVVRETAPDRIYLVTRGRVVATIENVGAPA